VRNCSKVPARFQPDWNCVGTLELHKLLESCSNFVPTKFQRWNRKKPYESRTYAIYSKIPVFFKDNGLWGIISFVPLKRGVHHFAKQTMHCLFINHISHCQPFSKNAGILEQWNHVVLTHKTIILLYKYIYISTTTTTTFPIHLSHFCDSNQVPKFQHHFTNNQITPTSTT